MHKISLVALLAIACAMTANAGVVVVGHPMASPLTKEQVANVYLGKSALAMPLDLPDASPTKAQFYDKAMGREVSQMKATWARIVFTGKGRPPKEFADATALKREIAANPKAIGYIDSSAIDGSVKVLLTLD
ncbi:hypothetical protein [Piscinibacter gummiphilus]|uniref:Uncharacterized protein n=1 Tax=Piscinibacter gummiphilus TaxID=946333 RepID=A0A1W6L5N9_9BURK|nr:hypothetical protein [Piscinibacter gummiphilus]ARN19615.1 hypothetical protein A4W93_06615 [Piscinibacter gummiphilus]ATU64284.1 hypothetical protein CPZ87_06700 [Piscinibacter gummiphilus]GLS93483.1 hypothetical protein GCM10007918_07740 [Piscinibacter gummiphilus]